LVKISEKPNKDNLLNTALRKSNEVSTSMSIPLTGLLIDVAGMTRSITPTSLSFHRRW